MSQKLLSRQLIDRNSTVATFAQHLQITQVAKNMRGRNYELADGFLLDKIASGVQYCTTKDYVRVAFAHVKLTYLCIGNKTLKAATH